MIVKSLSSRQTKALGQLLGQKIKARFGKLENSLVIALEGELGSGKTTFTQGLAQGLGIKKPVTSPSFILIRRYPLKGGNFYHIDCYRVQREGELLELGFKEIISEPRAVIVIEWAEKIKNILPRQYLRIQFSHQAPKKRIIQFSISQ